MILATTELNAATFGAEENCHLVADSKYFKGLENNTKPKWNAAFEWSYGKMGQVDGLYWDQDKWPNLAVNMNKAQCKGLRLHSIGDIHWIPLESADSNWKISSFFNR